MFLVRTKNPESLKSIASSLDAIDDFANCDLGDLNSLGLTELCADSSAWIGCQPIFYSEDGGLAIFPFATDGILWMRDNADSLTDFGADPDAVRAFASLENEGEVFAIDTF